MAGSLDTSIVLRVLLEDIPEKTQAAVDLLSRPDAKFRVEAVVFTEAAHVMTRNYQLSRSKVAEVLMGFASMECVDCDEAVINEALEIFVGHPALSFEDCYLTVAARERTGGPLYTFDKKLARQVEWAKTP